MLLAAPSRPPTSHPATSRHCRPGADRPWSARPGPGRPVHPRPAGYRPPRIVQPHRRPQGAQPAPRAVDVLMPPARRHAASLLQGCSPPPWDQHYRISPPSWSTHAPTMRDCLLPNARLPSGGFCRVWPAPQARYRPRTPSRPLHRSPPRRTPASPVSPLPYRSSACAGGWCGPTRRVQIGSSSRRRRQISTWRSRTAPPPGLR